MIRKVSEKQKERNKNKADETLEMQKLFREIWDSQEDEAGYCYCFESGKAMHYSEYRLNTCCFDHVLEKGIGSYPQYKMLKKNIIIVHPDIHTQKGKDIDKTPKIKKYREYLLSLHNKGEL
jgi:hypothetical protein